MDRPRTQDPEYWKVKWEMFVAATNWVDWLYRSKRFHDTDMGKKLAFKHSVRLLGNARVRRLRVCRPNHMFGERLRTIEIHAKTLKPWQTPDIDVKAAMLAARWQLTLKEVRGEHPTGNAAHATPASGNAGEGSPSLREPPYVVRSVSDRTRGNLLPKRIGVLRPLDCHSRCEVSTIDSRQLTGQAAFRRTARLLKSLSEVQSP